MGRSINHYKNNNMKHIKYIIAFSFLAMSIVAIGQSIPQAFSFQALAMDASGALVADQDIDVRIELIKSIAANSETVYAEEHSVTTSDLGHFTLEIGRGTQLGSSFSSVAWEQGTMELELFLDLNQDGNFNSIGRVTFVSVPYAIVAEESKVGVSGPQGPPGRAGAQGAPGPKGADGGTLSNPSTASLRGERGPRGPDGADGEKGDVGPEGPSGATGGRQGVEGPRGVQGAPGPDSNIRGPQGPQGPEGARGRQGIRGATGVTGAPGIGGGPKGPEGIVGPKGPSQGNPGPTGPPGDVGDQGPSGPQGPQGSRADDGIFFMVMTSVEPDPTSTNAPNIYLDSGVNRTDGQPGFRKLINGSYVDL